MRVYWRERRRRWKLVSDSNVRVERFLKKLYEDNEVGVRKMLRSVFILDKF